MLRGRQDFIPKLPFLFLIIIPKDPKYFKDLKDLKDSNKFPLPSLKPVDNS